MVLASTAPAEAARDHRAVRIQLALRATDATRASTRIIVALRLRR